MSRRDIRVRPDASRGAPGAGRPPRRALVVDDDGQVRGLLRRTLEAGNYECEEAASGEEALNLLSPCDPDAGIQEAADPCSRAFNVILLDIAMPRMGGLDVVRSLRASDDATAIVMVTAFDEISCMREALELGADGYLVKPIDIRQLRMACEEAIERRRIENAFRSSAQAWPELAGLFFHDIKNPISVARGYLSLLQMCPEAIDSADIVAAQEGCDHAINMIEEFMSLDVMESQAVPVETCRHKPLDIVQSVVDKWRPTAERMKKRIVLRSAPALPLVRADEQLMRKAVSALLSNAVKHASTDSEVTVELSLAPDGHDVRLSLTDNGPSVPPEYREALFDKMRQGELRRASVRRSQGLGLPFAMEACRQMGARLCVEGLTSDDGHASRATRGCRFVVRLPLALQQTCDKRHDKGGTERAVSESPSCRGQRLARAKGMDNLEMKGETDGQLSNA